MEIAGGLYLEICEFPPWKARFGSGGRAAAAVSQLSPRTTLHTYGPNPGLQPKQLEQMGISVRTLPGETIVFVYAHPLAPPFISPPRDAIAQRAPLHVTGATVLRFGMLEGDAIVEADRAIYDCQTPLNPQPFGANKSRARELAVVVNEAEARAMHQTSGQLRPHELIIREQGAAVVIVKGGTRGAKIYRADGRTAHVPAYRSSSVFKIGTGDVFSALFAYYWGERRLEPENAADLASRGVAAYCETGALPISPSAGRALTPVGGHASGPVLLLSTADMLGRHWLAQEARHRLEETGAEVQGPFRSNTEVPGTSLPVAAALVISDGFGGSHATVNLPPVPAIVLVERGGEATPLVTGASSVAETDDFTSAIYFAAWAASHPVS